MTDVTWLITMINCCPQDLGLFPFPNGLNLIHGFYLKSLGAHPGSPSSKHRPTRHGPCREWTRRNRDGQVAALAAQALAVSGVTGQRYEEARSNDWFVVRRGGIGGRGG